MRDEHRGDVVAARRPVVPHLVDLEDAGEVVRAVDDDREAAAHEGLVVGDDDARRHAVSP